MDRSTPPTANSQQPAAGVPVLLVDDDAPTRDILRMVLEDEGHSVAEAETIAAAVAHLHAATTSHVVLLDWLMAPGGKGGTLLHQVEQDAALQRHQYVLLTAAAPSLISDDEQHLIDAHCTEVVSKPFDLSTFLDAIARAAAQRPR